jgi:hypothetical protein
LWPWAKFGPVREELIFQFPNFVICFLILIEN